MMNVIKKVNKLGDIKEVVIDLQDFKLKGNVLDAGIVNYGIIYNLFKENNEDVSIDYVDEGEIAVDTVEDKYDTVVLFFSMSKIPLYSNRQKMLKELIHFMKEDGELLIWDINKNLGKVLNMDVKVLFPYGKSKKIPIREFNIIKGVSSDNTIKLLQSQLDIVEFKTWDNIYYIKACKKGRCSNESSINGS